MSKSFQDWLQEGEQLYEAALKEYRGIESQLDELESRLAAKQAEVNQIAQVIGKPPVEPGRRVVTAQLVDNHEQQRGSSSTPSIIARALTGKQIHR